jgi:hypothetical protein
VEVSIESARATEHNCGKRCAITPPTSQNDLDDSLGARTLNLIWVKVRSEVGKLPRPPMETGHLISGVEPVSRKPRSDQIDHDAGSSVLFLPQLASLVAWMSQTKPRGTPPVG